MEKKIYILIARGQIETISFELKVIYEDLKSKLSPFELKNLKSYSQISRDLKNKKDYNFDNTNQTYFQIIRKNVITSYRQYKKLFLL